MKMVWQTNAQKEVMNWLDEKGYLVFRFTHNAVGGNVWCFMVDGTAEIFEVYVVGIEKDGIEAGSYVSMTTVGDYDYTNDEVKEVLYDECVEEDEKITAILENIIHVQFLEGPDYLK